MATPILLDCDPGHDDAIALLLALASPEVELLGVTTVAGNQTLDKIELERFNVRVDGESSLCRGRPVVDVWRRTDLEPNARVPSGSTRRRSRPLARAPGAVRLMG